MIYCLGSYAVDDFYQPVREPPGVIVKLPVLAVNGRTDKALLTQVMRCQKTGDPSNTASNDDNLLYRRRLRRSYLSRLIPKGWALARSCESVAD